MRGQGKLYPAARPRSSSKPGSNRPFDVHIRVELCADRLECAPRHQEREGDSDRRHVVAGALVDVHDDRAFLGLPCLVGSGEES